MLQINPILDCTVYSGIVVHIGRNSQKSANYKNFACQYQKSQIFFVLPLFINQYESIYRPYEQTYNK